MVIDNFRYHFQQLLDGATGYISETEARPVEEVPDYAHLDQAHVAAGKAALNRAVVIKLNGGLGTSMGMAGPKSLLVVKNGLSFLDITVKQILKIREVTGARLPLIFMNSFHTCDATLDALAHYPDFKQTIPASFLQHKEPKIWKESLAPAEWAEDPDKEWCPPGHGDIYTAIVTSGLLDALLEADYEYAFVSNADNLGASLDVGILGYVAGQDLPFLMEVAIRTPADRKGGHLARRPDGQLVLRESAQCPPDEMEAFQDITRFRYFNTNNLWINLRTLHTILEEREGVIALPLIRNEKPIVPSDPATPHVYQLETAMGAAIAIFPGSGALSVPRSRFVPVKRNNDLLVLMSDAYTLNDAHQLELAVERQGKPPVVLLDDRYYGLIDEMWRRFPHGAPSLRRCDRLELEGDIGFGRNVQVRGSVKLQHLGPQPLWLADDVVLEGDVRED